MKARKIRDVMDWTEIDADVVLWDGSQKAFEDIVKMRPRDYEVSMGNGYLSIFDKTYQIEEEAYFGDYIIVKYGEMIVMHPQIFEWNYEVVEGE